MTGDARATLPLAFAVGGFSWRLRSEAWSPAAAAVVAHLEGEATDGSFERLKEKKGRYVFRCVRADGRFIGKRFAMRTARQKLWRYRRYAHAEASHLIEARRRGIGAPEVYGLGWRRRGPLVEATAVMIEDLAGYTALTRVGALDRDAQLAMLRPVADQLVALHAAGCNHLDLGTDNIFVAEDGSNDVRLIDFMHVRFLPEPSANVLAYHAAYLADSLRRCGVGEAVCREWVDYLFARVEVPRGVYEGYRGRRLTRRERFAISG